MSDDADATALYSRLVTAKGVRTRSVFVSWLFIHLKKKKDCIILTDQSALSSDSSVNVFGWRDVVFVSDVTDALPTV